MRPNINANDGFYDEVLKYGSGYSKIHPFLDIGKYGGREMKEQKRAAIYARVSTAGAGQDPEMQVRELNEYCERRGWIVVGEYVDRGISGAKDSRPQLDQLMEEAHTVLSCGRVEVRPVCEKCFAPATSA